jgi:hypothetical protein
MNKTSEINKKEKTMNKYLLSALLLIGAGVVTSSFAKITLLNKRQDGKPIYVRLDKSPESGDADLRSTVILQVESKLAFSPIYKEKEQFKEAQSIIVYIEPGELAILPKRVELQNNNTYEIMLSGMAFNSEYIVKEQK